MILQFLMATAGRPFADLYIGEGQSNKLGVGPSDDLASYDVGVDLLAEFERVFIYFYDNDALEPLHIPVNNMAANNGNYTIGAPTAFGAFGPEAGYAAAWLQDNPTGNLVILKDTVDGGNISQFAGAWNTTRQARHAAAFAAIEAQGWRIRTRVWDWVQGEGNMGDSQGSYQTALSDLIAAREADGTITEDTTIVLCKVPTDSTAYGAGVAAAMDAIAASDPTRIKSIAGTNSFNVDDLHKDAYGQMRDGANTYAIAYDKTPISLPGD